MAFVTKLLTDLPILNSIPTVQALCKPGKPLPIENTVQKQKTCPRDLEPSCIHHQKLHFPMLQHTPTPPPPSNLSLFLFLLPPHIKRISQHPKRYKNQRLRRRKHGAPNKHESAHKRKHNGDDQHRLIRSVQIRFAEP